MKVLAMVVAVVKSRGPWVLGIWVAGCVLLALVFRIWGERPLGDQRPSELTGMVFAVALVVLLGDAAVTLWRRARRKTKKAAKPRTRGTSHAS